MLTVIRNAYGLLDASCDWWLVDAQGRWEPKGEYVFINQLEINPGVSLHHVRRQLVREIGHLVPWAKGVYWMREHDHFPRPHGFRREQLVQLREEVSV